MSKRISRSQDVAVIWGWLIVLIFGFSNCRLGQYPALNNQPNIILIYADDLGYGDLSCYNPYSKIPTPHIDQLAQNGIRFTDAHAAAAVCTPSRYALLTGQYPFRSRLKSGVFWTYARPLIEKNQPTIASFLNNEGYHTAIIGKWHLGFDWPVTRQVSPEDWDTLNEIQKENIMDFSKPVRGGPMTAGFQYFFGMDTPNFPPYAFIENENIVGTLPYRLDSFTISGGVPGVQQPDWKNHTILPTLRQRTLLYLEEATRRNNPFFLFLSLTAPHTPIAPNQPYIGKSKAGDYGDFVVELDALVGELVSKIKILGIQDHTMIIFTSDNGSPGHDTQGSGFAVIKKNYDHDPSAPWRGIKGDSWEGGHRVPLIISWPQIIQSAVTKHTLVCQTDFVATMADILGIDPPSGLGIDSYTMMPLLDPHNDQSFVRSSIVHQSGKGHLSIRNNQWKLIKGKGSGGITSWIDPEDGKGPLPAQLYDLDHDPGEKTNLYGQLKYRSKVKDLENLLQQINHTAGSN